MNRDLIAALSILGLSPSLFAGCDSRAVQTESGHETRSLPQPRIRDSAGVRIVEYPELGPPPIPQDSQAVNPLVPDLRNIRQIAIDSVPFLTSGGAKEREIEELDSKYSIPSVLVLSDGSFVVPNKTRLMFYGSDGAFLRDAGRFGGGPGEFRNIGFMCLAPGDTILVSDQWGVRQSLWSKTGEHIRTFSRHGDVSFGACDPRGGIVMSDFTKAKAPPSDEFQLPGDFNVPFVSIRADGKLLQDLGAHRVSTKGWMHPMTTFALGTEEFHVGFARDYEVHTFDSSGQLKRITRLVRKRALYTDEQWRKLIEASAKRAESKERADAIRRGHERIGKPYKYPAYDVLRLDRKSRVWINDYGTASNWTVLDSSGVIVGRAELAGGAYPGVLVGFGNDFVVVSTVDSDLAREVRFYRLR